MSTAVAVLYCAGVVVFLVGVTIRILGGMWDHEELGVTGTLLNAAAWPIAVAGAIVDIRHRRHLAALAEGNGRTETVAE